MRAERYASRFAALAGILLLAASAGSGAEAQTAREAPPPQRPASTPEGAPAERPEYRARSLPSDTFAPSEQVSEDYPVPFPEDI